MEPYMLSLVVPVYNEEEVLPLSYARMQGVLAGLGCDYEMIYIDDGSSDGTWAALTALCERDPHVKALSFSRNFGHQLAVTAGMDAARGDCVVIIDVDLQDPPELIGDMVALWQQGYEIVYGQRKKREGESAFKKFTAWAYYRLLGLLSPIRIPLDTGDFRLIDRRVNETVCAMREHNRFLRGMSAWAGYKSCPIEYVRDERAAGQTKYTLKKMLKLAMDGIIGYSATPLTIAFVTGVALCGLCALGLLAMIVCAIAGVRVAGWLWLGTAILCMQGVLFVFMGILGAYTSRVYDEVKGRPLYIIGRRAGAANEKQK